MTLDEVLQSYGGSIAPDKKIGLSPERVEAIIPIAR